MNIHWYGHAAFLIETGGIRIILDPFRSPDSGGYAAIDEPADLVVVSHENDRYHSHLGQIVPPFEAYIRFPVDDYNSMFWTMNPTGPPAQMQFADGVKYWKTGRPEVQLSP